MAETVFDKVVPGVFPDVEDQVARAEGYDAIVCNDVLEHMAEPHLALASALRLLSADGVLVASIPNVRHVSVLGPLLLFGQWEYKESGILDKTHLRFFTKRSMRRLFEESGWTVLRIEGINRWFRSGKERWRWLLRTLAVMTRGHTDEFFCVNYAVVARAM